MSHVSWNGLRKEKNTMTASDFNASRDDDTSLSAGVVGEIAEAEIGEDSVFSQYKAVQVGSPATSVGGDKDGNEMFVKLQAGSSDISDSAQFAFAARSKGEIGGGKAGKITGFLTHRGQDNSDPRLRNSLPLQFPVVPHGEILTLQAKDETAALTVDLSESSFEIPFIGGK